jgi:hypothetical protein
VNNDCSLLKASDALLGRGACYTNLIGHQPAEVAEAEHMIPTTIARNMRPTLHGPTEHFKLHKLDIACACVKQVRHAPWVLSMSQIRTNMPVATQPWEAAKAKFLEGLSQADVARFRAATMENFFYSTAVTLRNHAQESRAWPLQQRMSSLADAIDDYG